MEEVWRECIPNYEASNLGRIRRSTPGRRTFAGKVMAAKLLKIGYYVVAPTVDGKNKTFYVHDLVARAFIGPKPDGMHVNHKDGDKQNNRDTNLEYVTRKENMEHAAATGLMPRGESHPASRLTEEDVRSIRSDRNAGLSYSRISAKHGVAISHAWQVCQGNAWRHVA